MDYHILQQHIKQKTANVVFHIPIPSSINSAGITWQAAVVKDMGGANAISSVLPDITTQEETDLKSGALLEQQVTVRFSSVSLTNAQRLQEIKDAFTQLKTNVLAEKQITLNFMGEEGTV